MEAGWHEACHLYNPFTFRWSYKGLSHRAIYNEIWLFVVATPTLSPFASIHLFLRLCPTYCFSYKDISPSKLKLFQPIMQISMPHTHKEPCHPVSRLASFLWVRNICIHIVQSPIFFAPPKYCRGCCATSAIIHVNWCRYTQTENWVYGSGFFSPCLLGCTSWFIYETDSIYMWRKPRRMIHFGVISCSTNYRQWNVILLAP